MGNEKDLIQEDFQYIMRIVDSTSEERQLGYCMSMAEQFHKTHSEKINNNQKDKRYFLLVKRIVDKIEGIKNKKSNWV